MPEEPTKPKSSVIKKLLLVLITIIVLVGLYQWAVHQGDKSQQRFMQKLELGDLMNAEAAKPEPPPAKAPDISIHEAVNRGDLAGVQAELDKGANVNAKMWRRTPLHSATAGGHTEIAELLIDNGADVNANEDYGWTPLHNAASEGHMEVAELLIAKGADVNAKNNYGDNPLHGAAEQGHKEIVELLIAEGADVNAKSEGGSTPLDLAYGTTADLLRKHGGKTGAELKGGEPVAEAAKPEPPTAKAADISIHSAAFEGNIEAVKKHLAAGTDVNVKNGVGVTPLHWPARDGLKEIAELLIANGADLNAKNVFGDTPLDWAIRFKHTKTADLLRKHGGKTGAELKAAGN
jgi:cytohesin